MPCDAPAVESERPRRRRDAAEARSEILDATEKRLISAGPAGIRLQEVAADAGVSHPTVLHHFGSREALVDAVVTRALQSMNQKLVEAIASSSGEEPEVLAMLDGVFDDLAKSGHARVLMWLALEGRRVDGGEVRLASVVNATHALRKSRRPASSKKKGPTREDTAHVVVLAALALIALPVLGPSLLTNAELGGDAVAMKRFRAFLAKVLLRHLDEP